MKEEMSRDQVGTRSVREGEPGKVRLHGPEGFEAMRRAGRLAADTLDFIAMFYVVLIFIWSLMSLFQVETYHPVYRLAGSLVEPLMRPLRGKLTAGGLDFAPWAVMIVLILARLLLVSPLTDLGARLALGI